SLSYELYFYFLIGVVVYLVPSRFHQFIFFTILAMTTFVTFINLTAYTFKGSIVNFFIGQNLWQFFLGLMSGYFFTHKKINPKTALIAVIVCSALFIIINIPFNTPISYVIYGPLAFGIVWLITSFEKSFTFKPATAEAI